MSYPVILDLKGRTVLVVGGGKVAQRKVEGLLQAGASVRLVAPELTPDLRQWSEEGRVDWLARGFEPLDLEGCWLIIAATNDRLLNRAIRGRAEEAGLWINVVDQPEDCSFTLPACLRRGELLITVSTGGASPLLSARLKRRLGRQFDQAWEPYLRLLRAVRTAVLERGLGPKENREIFEAVLAADLLSPLRAGDLVELARRLKASAGLDLDRLAWALTPPSGDGRPLAEG